MHALPPLTLLPTNYPRKYRPCRLCHALPRRDAPPSPSLMMIAGSLLPAADAADAPERTAPMALTTIMRDLGHDM